MESVTLNSLVDSKKSLVTQSNKLTEARYSLSVGEQRLVLTILSFISPNDEDFKDYVIQVSDLKRLLHLEHHAVHAQVKDALERLSTRSLTIPEEDGYLIANWFSSARYIKSKNVVHISIDPKLKPYLLQLKEQFTKFNLFTIAQFKSSYTIRIYMLLKQYERVGFREFDLQDFRAILGISNKIYPEFPNFRKRVINQAKKDFEKKENGFFVSDITFDLETIRTGRKITRLRFNIRKQTYQQHLDLAPPPDDSDNEDLRDVIAILEGYGISEKMAQNWLDKHGRKYIEEKIYLVKEQKPKNAGGYLRKAIEENYTSSSSINRQQEQSELDEEKRKLKSLFNKKWLELASNKYYEEKTEEIQNILPKVILDKLKENLEITHKDIKPDFIRDKTIESEYKQALKDQYIKSPTKEILEEIKGSIPAPRSSDFSDDVSVKIKIEKYIGEFSTIENA